MRTSVILLALAVAGCANGSYAGRQAPPVAASRSPARVSIQVTVPSRTMVAGSSMKAQVVVENRTGRAIHVIGCQSIFALALDSSRYHPDPAWASCAQEFTIGPGTSSYSVTLVASYLACGAGEGTPACRPGSDPIPPLPAGKYRALLFQSSPIGPAPAGIPVQVTPRLAKDLS